MTKQWKNKTRDELIALIENQGEALKAFHESTARNDEVIETAALDKETIKNLNEQLTIAKRGQVTNDTNKKIIKKLRDRLSQSRAQVEQPQANVVHDLWCSVFVTVAGHTPNTDDCTNHADKAVAKFKERF